MFVGKSIHYNDAQPFSLCVCVCVCACIGCCGVGVGVGVFNMCIFVWVSPV